MFVEYLLQKERVSAHSTLYLKIECKQPKNNTRHSITVTFKNELERIKKKT